MIVDVVDNILLIVISHVPFLSPVVLLILFEGDTKFIIISIIV